MLFVFLNIEVRSRIQEPLFDWLKLDVNQRCKTISKKDFEILQLVDTAEEAFKLIKTKKR